MFIKIMIVPGRIISLNLRKGSTVMDAVKVAEKEKPEVDWRELAKTREVRVQNKKFSNNEITSEGDLGNIHCTPLNDGDVVLILTKIQGNASAAVITCKVNGEEYALETPVQVGDFLQEVVGIIPSTIKSVLLNGRKTELSCLVGQNDSIRVRFK